MKKKILGVLLSLAMVGTLMAGCGQQQGVEDQMLPRQTAHRQKKVRMQERTRRWKKQLCTGSKEDLK